jgi:hypothetical protein
METFNAETAWAKTIFSTPLQEELSKIFVSINEAISKGETHAIITGNLSPSVQRYLTELNYDVHVHSVGCRTTISW